jgi:copper resistance protein D
MGLYLMLNNTVHLLAVGLWVGGLLPLSACLVVFPYSVYRIDLTVCLRRYSSFGQLAVCLVLVTGALNAFMILGTFPSDWTSKYQSILLIKVLLVAVMIAIALFNRYVLVRNLTSNGHKILTLLIKACWLEIGIGAAVICLVSFLGELQPL